MYKILIFTTFFLPLSVFASERTIRFFEESIQRNKSSVSGDLIERFIENIARLGKCDWRKPDLKNDDYFEGSYWQYAGFLHSLKPLPDERFLMYQKKTNAVINNLNVSIVLLRKLAMQIKKDWDEYKDKSTPEDVIIKKHLKLAADTLSRFSLVHLRDYIPDWASVCPIDTVPIISLQNAKEFTNAKRQLKEQYKQEQCQAVEEKCKTILDTYNGRVKAQDALKETYNKQIHHSKRQMFWNGAVSVGLALATYKTATYSYIPYVFGVGSALCGLEALLDIGAQVQARNALAKLTPVPEPDFSSLKIIVIPEPTDSEVWKSLALEFNINDELK